MNSPTLESVEAAFCEWRVQRRNGKEAIPEELWIMALDLYPQYKRSHICHRLGLSGSRFKERLERNEHTSSDNGFVLASRVPVNVNVLPRAEVQLTLQGKERSLTFCIDVHALTQILPYVGALL